MKLPNTHTSPHNVYTQRTHKNTHIPQHAQLTFVANASSEATKHTHTSPHNVYTTHTHKYTHIPQHAQLTFVANVSSEATKPANCMGGFCSSTIDALSVLANTDRMLGSSRVTTSLTTCEMRVCRGDWLSARACVNVCVHVCICVCVFVCVFS